MKLTRKFCVKMQGGMFVKSLFSYADAYIKNCTWKDLALVKFCLCAIGVMIGLSVPKEKRKIPFLGSLFVFLVTYFPLMGNYPCYKSRTEKTNSINPACKKAG